jgi:conjugative relaxase-like TrwC/TraI family protein
MLVSRRVHSGHYFMTSAEQEDKKLAPEEQTAIPLLRRATHPRSSSLWHRFEPAGGWFPARSPTDNLWWGGLAEQLGIARTRVTPPALELALNGYLPGQTPDDGPLRPIPAAANAGRKSRRGGVDLVFSVPKAVSLLWAGSSPEQRAGIERANRQAVVETLAWWIDHGLATAYDPARKTLVHEHHLLVALFEHGSSRANDPHLHTHCVVTNLSARGGRILLNNRLSIAADKVFLAHLCRSLQQQGHPVRPDVTRGLTVESIPDEIAENFSHRRRLIMEMTAGGNFRQRQWVAMQTRFAKRWLDPREKVIHRTREILSRNLRANGEPTPDRRPSASPPGGEVTPEAARQDNPTGWVHALSLTRNTPGALHLEVLALGQLMLTCQGQTPSTEDITTRLEATPSLVRHGDYWIDRETDELVQECWQRLQQLHNDRRLRIITDPAETETWDLPVTWLYPGQQSAAPVMGLRRAEWWTARQLDPILNATPDILILQFERTRQPQPGYPAARFFEAAPQPDPNGLQPGLPLAAAPPTSHPTRRRTNPPTSIYAGHYGNTQGFHGCENLFLYYFCAQYLTPRPVFMISTEPEIWQAKLRSELQSWGIVGTEPLAIVEDQPLAAGERLRWSHVTHRKSDWQWGLLVASQGHHLLVRMANGKERELHRNHIRLTYGYALHPDEVRDVPHYRYGYFFSRATIRQVPLPPTIRESNRHRNALIELLRDRPVKASVFFAVEPWRRQSHPPADTPEVNLMRMLPAMQTRQRPTLAVLIHLTGMLHPTPLVVHTPEGQIVSVLGAPTPGESTLLHHLDTITTWQTANPLVPLHISPGRSPESLGQRTSPDWQTIPDPSPADWQACREQPETRALLFEIPLNQPADGTPGADRRYWLWQEVVHQRPAGSADQFPLDWSPPQSVPLPAAMWQIQTVQPKWREPFAHAEPSRNFLLPDGGEPSASGPAPPASRPPSRNQPRLHLAS